MNKEIYNKVGKNSVLLNQKLEELKKCHAEKEALYKKIDEMRDNNTLTENFPQIEKELKACLNKFNQLSLDLINLQIEE